MTPSDERVRAAIVGDADARDEVGRWLVRELRQFFAGYRDRDKLTELLQDTMIAVWSSGARKAPRDALGFRGWVVSVAVVTAKATRRLAGRERARKAKLVNVPAWQTPRSLSSTLGEADRWNTIDACAEQLATPYREAIADLLSGASIDEIAAARGISVATVCRRRNKAAEQIGRMIASRRVTPPPHGS